MSDDEFAAAFQALTGNPPFPWQTALFRRFVADDLPDACDLPTGLGKTAVIAVWLIALAVKPTLPRRLVYVVNRRTVVDQSTREAERLRANLDKCPAVCDALKALAVVKDGPPLAISTLRGQFADNREWCEDPARPAVVAGTVDMIGSRLLFSGYRSGYKSKPLHAGFLGQDALIVHDEAHLEPAFQALLERIAAEQGRCDEQKRRGDLRPVRVMQLTATPRGGSKVFELTEAEKTPPKALPEPIEPIHHVWQRLRAANTLDLKECEEKKLSETIAQRAVTIAQRARELRAEFKKP